MAGLRNLDLGDDAVLYAITPDPPESDYRQRPSTEQVQAALDSLE